MTYLLGNKELDALIILIVWDIRVRLQKFQLYAPGALVLWICWGFMDLIHNHIEVSKGLTKAVRGWKL